MIREDKKVIGQKVLLLIFALLFFAMLAIGLLYLSTTSQIESPEIKDNIHKEIAESRIKDFRNCANLKAYDSLYNVTKHKIILYKAEGYVKEDWIKELKRKFVDESETAFNTLCKYLICSTTPDSRTYKYIIKIFDEKIKPTRKEFFKSTNYSALPDVEGIVSRYKETCELIKKKNNIYVNCQYTSKEDAANKISKANSLIADQYIKNCRFLIEELNKVGAQIEKSHRHKINNQLEEFKNCLYSNYVRYNSLSLSISGLIADYESLFSGKSYKGTNDINTLKQRFNSLIKDKADRHYRYVESCVEQLSGYRTMTESYFDELVRNANNEIEGYKTRKSTTYGVAAKNCDNLKTTLDIYKKNADTHYHPIITHIVKRVYNIRPNGQWMFMKLDGNNRIYEWRSTRIPFDSGNTVMPRIH